MGQRRASLNLPVELLEHILGQPELSFRDVLRCERVNRGLRDVINRSLSLRYKVELGAHGMVDGTPGMRVQTSTVYRMKQLEASQESWDRFQWTSQQTLTFPLWPISLLDGDLLAMLEGEDLKLLRMPSKFRNLKGDEKVLRELALDDLYIDKALKLLVAIRRDPTEEPVFSAALLHLDTGKPHPSASIPVLVQSLTAKRSDGWSFAMSVTGPYLAVLFQNFTADYDAEDWSTRTDWNDQEDTLVVWNWHTGARMMTIKCCCIRSFVFLDFARILVGHITPSPDREPLLRVVDVQDGDVEVSLKDASRTFHFPTIALLAADINIHCEPTPTWCPGQDEETLFSVAPEHRIIVITLRATRDNIFNSDSYTIVVLFHDLMSHINSREGLEGLPGSGTDTPWAEWGGNTRLFYPTSAHGCSDLLSVYGTRFISIPLERSRTMEIIDFNPYTIRRRLSDEAEAEAEAKNDTGSGSTPAQADGETVANDQGNVDGPELTNGPGDGEVVPGDNPDATSDPKYDEQENRSRIVTDAPFLIPAWIPPDATGDCSLPYTSYEIPIPLDLNMDFCIDVMMGQDTIVFMFDNEAGDEYTWSILSF